MSWKNTIKKGIEDEFDEDYLAERDGRMEGYNEALEERAAKQTFTMHDVKQYRQFFIDELISDAKDIMRYIDSVRDRLSDKEIIDNILDRQYKA